MTRKRALDFTAYILHKDHPPSWESNKNFLIFRPTKLSTAQATLLIFIMLAFALAIVILEKTFRNCNAGRRTEANGYIIYPWPWTFSSSRIFEKIKALLITYTWRLPVVACLRILIFFLILTILRPNSTCQIGRNSCSCLKICSNNVPCLLLARFYAAYRFMILLF